MSIRRIIKEFYEEKQLREGFDLEGNPDLKYYDLSGHRNNIVVPVKSIIL